MPADVHRTKSSCYASPAVARVPQLPSHSRPSHPPCPYRLTGPKTQSRNLTESIEADTILVDLRRVANLRSSSIPELFEQEHVRRRGASYSQERRVAMDVYGPGGGAVGVAKVSVHRVPLVQHAAVQHRVGLCHPARTRKLLAGCVAFINSIHLRRNQNLNARQSCACAHVRSCGVCA